MQHGIIDGPFDLSPDLRLSGVDIFVIHEKIRDIAMPEIAVKSALSCRLKKFRADPVQDLSALRGICPLFQKGLCFYEQILLFQPLDQ